jgi:hypothetical protein
VNHVEQLKTVEGKEKPQALFMRKGNVGGYKEEMPKEYIGKFDEWIRKSLEGREHRFNLS